jgi:uncharacterized protein YjiS (DUF1127 family)
MSITRSTLRTAPALTGSSGWFQSALDALAETLRRRQIRRIYGCMSRAQLHDIGLTPQDVVTALALPLDRDAGAALATAAAREAARW